MGYSAGESLDLAGGPSSCGGTCTGDPSSSVPPGFWSVQNARAGVSHAGVEVVGRGLTQKLAVRRLVACFIDGASAPVLLVVAHEVVQSSLFWHLTVWPDILTAHCRICTD